MADIERTRRSNVAEESFEFQPKDAVLTMRISKALVEKVKATDPSDDPCGMGSCYEQGYIAVSCQSPNGPNPSQQITCDVQAAKK